MCQNSTIVGIPLNYSLFSSSYCIASYETSLAFHLHPKKETKNLWGWSTMSFIGGGHNLMTSMRRSSQTMRNTKKILFDHVITKQTWQLSISRWSAVDRQLSIRMAGYGRYIREECMD